MSVRIERDGTVTTIIHSRYEARNAMDPDSADALVTAFERFDSGARLCRKEPAGFLSEIEQDAAGFEHRDRLPVRTVVIDNRRDLVVGVNFQELRVELPALAE